MKKLVDAPVLAILPLAEDDGGHAHFDFGDGCGNNLRGHGQGFEEHQEVGQRAPS